MDAWVRMLRLMERPADIAALAPAYEREILYRVLQGRMAPCCATSRRPTVPCARQPGDSMDSARLRRAVARGTLAEKAAMSAVGVPSAFQGGHRAEPVQYQKRVRLLQARTLLIVRRARA
jgi:hypothetical protein